MSTDTVTLVNQDRARGKFLGELPHDIICRRTGACACAKRHVLTPGGKRKAVRTPAAFTVFVGGRTEVPRLALGLKPVKRAIALGWLHVEGLQQPRTDDPTRLESVKHTQARDAGQARLVPNVASSPRDKNGNAIVQMPLAQAVAFAEAKPPNVSKEVAAAIEEGAQALKSPTKRSK